MDAFDVFISRSRTLGTSEEMGRLALLQKRNGCEAVQCIEVASRHKQLWWRRDQNHLVPIEQRVCLTRWT